MSAYGGYASSILQQKPGSAALRKVALPVEQLATALGATLGRSHPASSAASADPGVNAQTELEYALQRLRPIDHVAGCKQANGSSLVFVEDEAALAAAMTCGAGAILLTPSLLAQLPAGGEPLKAAVLVVNHPRLEFARAARLLNPVEPPTRRHPSAFVSVGATLGSRVGVGPFAVIEQGAVVGQGSTIGAGAVLGAGVIVGVDCRIYPRVVIYPGTKLGDRVVVHAGAVLGSDGFGYVRDETTGAYLQFPQQGSLVIEDDVEIGANTTIDRGALEETRIARGAKLDNLVHLGHNVRVGADAILAAQVGISGSSAIGAGAVLAGQVGVGDHAAVGEGVVLGGQAGVLPHKTLRGPGKLFWGTPAKPVKQYLRELASLRRLVRRGKTEEGA